MIRNPKLPMLAMYFLLASAGSRALLAAGAPTGAPESEPPSAASVVEGAAASEPTPLALEEAVVVTATRDDRALLDVPASVTVVDLDAERERGFFFVAADELRGQPAISFRRGAGDNDDFLFVNLRGITGNHGNDSFLALLDGIPFVGADEEIYMNDLPYPAIGGVELVRGPVSALYGRGALAGALAYTTRDPRDSGGEISLAAGSDEYGRFDAQLDRSWGSGRALFLGSYESSAGWRDQNEREVANLFAKLLSTPGDSSTLTLTANFYDKSYETGSALPVRADGSLIPIHGGREGNLGSASFGRYPESDRTTYGLTARWNEILSDRSTLETTLHGRRLEKSNVYDFWDSFGFDESQHLLGVNGFSNQVEEETLFGEGVFTFSGSLGVSMAGVNLERISLDEDDQWTGQNGFTYDCGFTFFLISIDYTSGNVVNREHPCFVVDQPTARFRGESDFASLFAQHEWRFGERTTLTLGARYDRFERRTVQAAGETLEDLPEVSDSAEHLSPKLSLARRLGGDHLLYASYGQGFSSNFGPYWQWNPEQYVRDTRPTELDSLELGIKGTLFDRRLTYTASLFQAEQRDRLLLVSNPDAAEDFTVPGTLVTTGQRYRSRGVELLFQGRLGTSTSIELSGSIVDAEWQKLVLESFSGPVDFSGNAATGVPESQAALRIDHAFGPRFRTHLSASWYDDYAVTLDNSVRGGSYELIDLALTWLPPRGVFRDLTLSVTNALDLEYEFLFGDSAAATHAVPGVPRQVRLTARIGWN